MWYHTDGYANQYLCVSAIYPLRRLALELFIIFDRAVGVPGNGKDVVDAVNFRDKLMLKL